MDECGEGPLQRLGGGDSKELAPRGACKRAIGTGRASGIEHEWVDRQIAPRASLEALKLNEVGIAVSGTERV